MNLEDKINSIIGTNYDYKKANCWDLVRFLNPNAPDIEAVHESVTSTIKKFAEHEPELAADFKTVMFPSDGDIVLLGGKDSFHHAGIYYANGIVHADRVGVIWQPLPIIKIHYPKSKAYKWRH